MKLLKKLVPIFILSSLVALLNIQQDIQKDLLVQESLAATELVSEEFEKEFSDKIEPTCSLLDNINFNQRHDFVISLTIPNSEKWYTNIIKGEFLDGARIAEAYKKEQFAFFTFTNIKDQSKCIIDSKVRISGDAADHINIEKLVASLDVELLSDNLFGYTDFKLFLPESRKYENEIFVTSLLSNLGYLAPTSFFIDIEVNGTKTKYIFQEKINKIFIESNNLKEGPILEPYEQIAWGENEWFTFNTLLPPKINNKTWLKKSINNIQFAKFAIEKLHKIKIFGIDEGDLDTYFCADCVLNYESLDSKNSSYLKEYQLLLTVFRAHHGLSYSDRKYYVDPNTEFLYSIYYDGTPTLLKEKNDLLILNESQLGDEQWEQKVPILYLDQENIDNLVDKISNLDYKKFREDLSVKGVEIDKLNFSGSEFKNYIIKDITSYSLDLNIESKGTFESYFSNNQEKSQEFYLLIEKDDDYQICQIEFVNCTNFKFNPEAWPEILSGDFYHNDRVVFYIGNIKNLTVNSNTKFNSYNSFKADGLSYGVYYSEQADFRYKDSTLFIENPSPGFRVFIESEELINEKIIFSSNNNNFQYSETLLTGCINIINSKLLDFEFESNNTSCEDALNIISSSGSIKSIDIKNSKYDGVDFDFSDFNIEKLTISNSGNDCGDFSYGIYIVKEAYLLNCEDKAFSIGERSNFLGEKIIVQSSNIAFAAKDSSEAIVQYLESENSKYCTASYRKKQEFGSPNIEIKNLVCDSKNSYIQSEKKDK